ncbi:MAG TPA: lipocalin-like domain-containing protein [Steroidobacteraceae bacterium]|nr:lipocalin-like domain-containing protein [Steroidobacteraceae bacterium]
MIKLTRLLFDEEKVTPAEKVVLYDAYVAYFGTYSVDMKRGVVIHPVAGDRLTLTPRWTVDGKQWTGVRVFERVK